MVSGGRKRRAYNEKLLLLVLWSFLNMLSVVKALPMPSNQHLRASSNNGVLKDIENPSELAWQAMQQKGELQRGDEFDSSNFPRRLTAKSIFQAPTLQCVEGEAATEKNRCRKPGKTVSLNQSAHLAFIVNQLNAKFPKPQVSQSTEPFQVNIPFPLDPGGPGESNRPSDVRIEAEKTENTSKKEETSTQVKTNDQTPDKKTLIPINPSLERQKNDQPTVLDAEQLVPVIDFVDDSNSNASDIVDYQIPVVADVGNKTEGKLVDRGELDIEEEGDLDSELPANDSTTRAPGEDTANTRNESRTQETINVTHPQGAVTDSTVVEESNDSTSPASDHEDAEIVAEKQIGSEEDEREVGKNRDTITKEDEDIETQSEDEFDDFTDAEDEILKHSEAGLGVTVSPIRFPTTIMFTDTNESSAGGRISSQVSINDDFIRETTVIGVNINSNLKKSKESDSSLFETTNKDDNTTPITAESKIDVVTVFPTDATDPSTIFLDDEPETNTDRVPTEAAITETTTESGLERQTLPPTTEPTFLTTSENINPVVRIEDLSLDDAPDPTYPPSPNFSRIIFRDDAKANRGSSNDAENAEIMVASSTNIAATILPRREVPGEHFSPSFLVNKLINQKRTGPTTPEATNPLPISNNEREMYDFEPDSRVIISPDLHRIEESDPVIKTIDDQRKELERPPEREHNYFPEKFDSISDFMQNYVRFPSYVRLEPRPGYVRFPGEEANSIHTRGDFKDQFRRPYQGNRNLSKNSANRRDRTDRQQNPRPRSGGDSRLKGRGSKLKRVWTEMPLFKDPSLLQVDGDNSAPAHGRLASRRGGFYRETSPVDGATAFVPSSQVTG